ncbi:MAG: hypothetical protein FJ261_14540 [Planctomycetes bacterium]|nr:hypothetical protein [Planctomycetota bacterium]
MTPRELLETAIRYTELGYRVFPCIPRTKHPITEHGFKDASTDPAQIECWWSQHPTANIGIAAEGMLIVDIDGANNPWPGDPERSADLASAGAVAQTPHGGRHYLFRRPEGKDWKCSVGKLAPGVDIRTDGCYIVAVPSVIPEGSYHWVEGLNLEEGPDQLPVPPAWLVERLDTLTFGFATVSNVVVASGVANAIPEGQRNATLAKLAGTMRCVGMSRAEIAAALHRTNFDRCIPPLDELEVDKTAASVARYEPDQIATAMAENHFQEMFPAKPRHPIPVGKETRIRCVPDVICLADIEPQKVLWLWPGRIPLGRLMLLVGRPGAGKSFLTCDMIARISRGSHWPEPGFNKAQLGDSLLICAEDDPADTIAPRLIAADADRRRIHLLKAAKIIEVDGKEHSVAFDLSNVDLVRDTLEHLPECRMVVIDPIGSYLGGGVDAHRDNEVRSVLAPLAVLAAERGVAIVLVCHTRKASASFADDTALGSRAFVGLARSVLHLTADENDRDRKLLLPGKCNLSVSPPGLAFRIVGDPARLIWEPEPLKGFHADDAMTPGDKETTRGPAPTTRDAATVWLAELVRAGPMPVEEIKQQAKAAELGWRTIRRANEVLGIVPRKRTFAGGWEWALPEGGQPDAEGGHDPRRCPSSEKPGHLRENEAENGQKPLYSWEGGQVDDNLATFGDDAGNVATFEADGGLFPEHRGLPD